MEKIVDLNNIISNNKVISVEHPELEGFVVDVSYISRERMKKVMEKCTTTKYNRSTHKPEEEVDQDLFLKIYVKELIKGWKGLKFKYLPELVPVDVDLDGNDDELDYDENQALTLMKNSTEFDNWLSNVIADVRNFNKSS